jgi:1,4-dihydroxy-6-naphthoate synthase
MLHSVTSQPTGSSGNEEAAVSDALSIVYSPCPNDTFVFHAWSHGLVPGAPPVEVTHADIDVTNGMVERGEGDILKISYAALPGVLDRYALLPCGGALGHGCGPLVVTADPAATPEKLTGAVVAVPSERSTAYLLFRLWARHAVPGGVGRIVVLPFHEIMSAVRDGTVDAGLVIHEARFTYQEFGLHMTADLGAAWESRSGLPIPLGAIVARRSLGAPRLLEIATAIRASVAHAWAAPDDSRAYVREHAQELAPEVQQQHIGLYVNEFTADLGPTGYAAVRALLRGAAEEGLCEPPSAQALAFPGPDAIPDPLPTANPRLEVPRP